MCRKIHVALVGGQAMPVYVGIFESNADEVILLHSKESKPQADKIKAGVYKMNNLSGYCQLVSFPSVDYLGIVEALRSFLSYYVEDLVEVNLSSGTKAWAIAFSELAHDYNNLTLCYIDQNCFLYNCTNKKKREITFPSGIATIMSYNNQRVLSKILESDYTAQDYDVLKGVEEARMFNQTKFNELTIPVKANKKQYEEGKNTVRYGDAVIEWDKTKGDGSYVNLKMVNGNGGIERRFSFTSKHSFNLVMNSGWFEYKVAKLLEGWSRAQEIWMNVVFPYKPGKDGTRKSKNEIDVIVHTGKKLLFVECKTSVFDKTDIDKFAAAVKNYGGMGSKALFITGAKLYSDVHEKCKTNGILAFSLLDNHNSAERLYEVLEKELFNINTR